MERAVPSMWPSVTSWPVTPGSRIVLEAPKQKRSSASIRTRVLPGLRPPASSTRNSGPVSRIQRSETGRELMTVTVDPYAVRACEAAGEPSAHMTSGSYFAVSLASLAMSAWILDSRLPQIVELDGQAVVLCLHVVLLLSRVSKVLYVQARVVRWSVQWSRSSRPSSLAIRRSVARSRLRAKAR